VAPAILATQSAANLTIDVALTSVGGEWHDAGHDRDRRPDRDVFTVGLGVMLGR